jgi:1-deoxy-D-xylulose-5-phosphate reductoisomerase
VDSATLINKAFEVIESHWLFELPFEKIEVVVHPQSVVHSMIELADNSIKAQMGPPDMRLPIQYSMFHPDRMPNDLIPRLDIANPYSLTFQPLELDRYPCFSLALDAGKRGGTYPAALSAADEVAVGLFLDRKIGYVDIGRVIERVLEEHDVSFEAGLDELVEVDRWARSQANYVAKSLAK